MLITAIALIALVGLAIAGVLLYYIWRDRCREREAARHHRDRLDELEGEGYHVSEFRGRWDDSLAAASVQSALSRGASLLVLVLVAAVALGGWTGTVGHFPPWDSPKRVVANFCDQIAFHMDGVVGILGERYRVRFERSLHAGEEVTGSVTLGGWDHPLDYDYDWEVEVYYDAQGDPLDGADGPGTVHAISFVAPYGGTYQIWVVHRSLYPHDGVIEVCPRGWTQIED